MESSCPNWYVNLCTSHVLHHSFSSTQVSGVRPKMTSTRTISFRRVPLSYQIFMGSCMMQMNTRTPWLSSQNVSCPPRRATVQEILVPLALDLGAVPVQVSPLSVCCLDIDRWLDRRVRVRRVGSLPCMRVDAGSVQHLFQVEISKSAFFRRPVHCRWYCQACKYFFLLDFHLLNISIAGPSLSSATSRRGLHALKPLSLRLPIHCDTVGHTERII